MVDFVTMAAAKQIIRELDSRNVTGVGLSWDRIEAYVRQQGGTTVDLVPVQVATTPEPEITLNDDQSQAWDRLQVWVDNPDTYFVLRGYAGTGKTFMMRKLRSLGVEMLFTAPTNKASKVLARSVGGKPTTIYSALGLKMTSEEDTKVLKFSERPPYIARGTIIVVDECSMVSRELYNYIDQAATKLGLKIAYVGDPAQLPPVGETRSPTWQATRETHNRAFLKQIMRYDNQLLTLATRIRECIQQQTYDVEVEDDNANGTGVFVNRRWKREIAQYTSPEAWRERKIIAWRNKTVDSYNAMVRENFGFTKPYHDGDIVLMAQPLEVDGVIVASIDEEFVVLNVESSVRTVHHRGSSVMLDVWVLAVEGDQKQTLVIPKQPGELKHILEEKAVTARNALKSQARAAWKDFWETKNTFHSIRYGYAMTAHRAQGSTYQEVFLDQHDILVNSNQREALRCLYVACTRAAVNIHSF